MGTERSYYEEALELIKERDNLWKMKQESEQTVPVIENSESKQISDNYSQNPKESIRPVLSKSSLSNLSQLNDVTPTNSNDFEQYPKETITTVSSKSSLNSSNQFLNEEKNIRNILPPLINKTDTEELNREDSRLSSISSLSTSSSTVFPKINSRYLPK